MSGTKKQPLHSMVIVTLIIGSLLLLTMVPIGSSSSESIPGTQTVVEDLTRTETKEWTVLVYMDADNNLESDAILGINSLELVGSGPDMNIVVQIDRINGHDSTNGDWTGTKRYYIQYDPVPVVINSPEVEDLGEANMGDINTLRDFIDWGFENYPAERYMLILWDHGSGHDGICFDDTDKDYIDITELSMLSWYNEENQFERTDFDIMVFDACIMQQMAVAYAVKDCCDYIIGSQDLIYTPGIPNWKVLERVSSDPDIETELVCNLFVQEYKKFFDPFNFDYSLSALDVEKMVYELAPLVNVLGERLTYGVRLYNNLFINPIENARFATWSQMGKFIDLWQFCRNLETQMYLPGTIGSYIVDYAAWTRNAVEESVIANANDGGEAPKGLSIFFPLDDYFFPGEYDDSQFSWEAHWDEFLGEYFSPGLITINPPLGPYIHIDEPRDQAFLNGTVLVEGKMAVNDDTPLATHTVKVEVSLDKGTWFETDIEATDDQDWYDWKFEMDTTMYPNGPHKLTARAFQRNTIDGVEVNGMTYWDIMVQFDNGVGNHPPRVTITDPEDGAEIRNQTSYTIKGTASDSDQGVQVVEINIDNGLDNWVTATGNESWSYEWDISQEFGEYYITARAYDGLTYSYDSITVEIINPSMNSPPIPVITSPQEGQQFETSDAIFFDGSNSTDPDGDPMTYDWSSNITGYLGSGATLTSNLPAGKHKVTLQVSDSYYVSSWYVNITVIEIPTETFFVLDYENGGYREVEAYLAQVRPECFIYVEKDHSTNAVNLADTFNDSIYPKVTTYLGLDPDRDSDGRVWVLACVLGGNVAGYYQDNDPNEKDMLYLDIDHGDTDTLAHEFGHMVHHNYDKNEERWIDEGLAQYTAHFVENKPITETTHIAYFFANPDVSLPWKAYDPDLLRNLAQYGVGAAFQEYLSEQFGGVETIGELLRDGESFTPGVNPTYQGIEAVEAVLALNNFNLTFDDLFINFTAANFLDDPEYGTGELGYPDIFSNAAPTDQFYNFPAQHDDLVSSYAADYYEVRGTQGIVSIEFYGENGGKFDLALAGFDEDGAVKTLVNFSRPELVNNYANLTLPGLLEDFDVCGLIVTCLSDEAMSYNITVNVIDTTNFLPVADAGADITVRVREVLTFDASNSTDPDGTISQYLWDFDLSNGIDWDIPDSKDAKPTYRYDTPGNYTATLLVKDNKGGADQDTLFVNVLPPNKIPVAEAGENQFVRILDEVLFDPNGSYDPDTADKLTYHWDFGEGNTSDEMMPIHIFEEPNVYTVTLTVMDDYGAKAQDTCTIDVKPNKDPIPDAGSDQRIREGDWAYFNASSTVDPEKDPMSFYWDFDSSDGLTHDADGITAKKQFKEIGEFTVTLMVEDIKGGYAIDEIRVIVSGVPTADAGEDMTVRVNEEVTIDGSGSIDPQESPLKYFWDLDDDGAADRTDESFTYKFRKTGVYNISLEVKNTAGYTDTDTIQITVLEAIVLHTPVFTSPENYDEVKNTITITGEMEGWQNADGLYYNIDWQGWIEISLTGSTFKFNVDTTDYVDGEMMIMLKAVMGEEETDPSDAVLVLVVANEVEEPKPPVTDDDIIDDDVTDDDDDDDDEPEDEEEGPFGMSWYDFTALLAFIIIDIIIFFGIIYFVFLRRKPAQSEMPKKVEWEPDEEEEVIMAEVELADEGDSQEGVAKFKVKDEDPFELTEEELQEIESEPEPEEIDIDDDFIDDDTTESWLIDDEGPEPDKPSREVREVKCQGCGEMFEIVDDGTRPLTLTCTHCGKEGVIKGDGPTMGDTSIKCPSCSKVFKAYTTADRIVCPGCGASGGMK